MKLTYTLTIAIVLFAGGATLAQAHAFLDHAEPKVGATVAASPASVKIWFTRLIETPASTIAVFDTKGVEVDRKDTRLDSSDGSLMSVSLPKLPLGSYKVVWNAVCRDTHHTTGTFNFVVSGAP